MIKQSYALISVFNKDGVVELGQTLHKLGYQIVSTGGTAKVLAENKIPVIPIQDVTGNPESFDGRIKTISFQVEAGILYDRKNSSHLKQAKELGIKPIEIVVCNLYPFEEKPEIENIDVGGPTMIRAAAKNFKHVLVVVDPKDYKRVAQGLKKNKLTDDLRQELSSKAFAHLSFYDSQIARFFSKEKFPKEITIPGRKSLALRYGENPHQKAAVYFSPQTNSVLKQLKKFWGRDLSWLNLTDINAGLEVVRLFKEPAVTVIKHNSPSGIALGKSSNESLKRAIEADPESAFGGVVVLNTAFDINAAKIIASFKDEQQANIDIIAAPSISSDGLKLLKKVRKSMGIYVFGKIPLSRSDNHYIRFIDGGFILQTPDDNIENGFKDWKVVSKIKPEKSQLEQMQVAWKFISRIKSNAAIVVDKNLPMTRGIGTGQTSRVRSTKIALEQAGRKAKGAVLASDAFFPFDDSVKLAEKYGISAIVQPGGSVNDQMSIDAANKAGMVMVFTNRRAFWH